MPLHANLDAFQDRTIESARAATYIDDLIEIITDLDNQLSDWKRASGCDTPGELETLLFDFNSREQ